MPIRYVFVPCKVIGPGLHPSIRIRFELIFVITGIGVNLVAIILKCCQFIFRQFKNGLKTKNFKINTE